MTTDDLKAWLLLAGFSYSPKENTYFQYLSSSYHDYAIVHFLADKTIAVASRRTHNLFVCVSTTQQYIQKLIGE